MPVIEISTSVSMKRMWEMIDDVLDEDQDEHLRAELVHDAPLISTLLLVDSRFLPESVREFCSRKHIGEDSSETTIPLDYLEELLPVHFTD